MKDSNHIHVGKLAKKSAALDLQNNAPVQFNSSTTTIIEFFQYFEVKSSH